MPNREGLTDLSLWTRHRAVAYFTGKGIIFGADAELFPRKAVAPGKFAIYADTQPHPVVAVCGPDFDACANGVFDYVFVGRRLGDLTGDPREFLKECTKKLKLGGHLIVFSAMSSSQSQSFDPEKMKGIVGSIGSWVLKDTYIKNEHFLQIYKYQGRSQSGVTERKRTTKKRVCIARYGAMGDLIMITPLIHKLHDEGYEVTVNLSPYSAMVLQHNPYIDNIVIQERDAIPNHQLGLYWKEWESEYDKYINLSESIEGALLKVEGRRDFFTHKDWRHQVCNRNYFDYTMERGGYPDATGLRGELFFTRSEIKEAQHFREKFKDKYIIMWAMNGSSFHKRYGLFQPVMTSWLNQHPDALLMTVGDKTAQQFEFSHPRVFKASGLWPVRHSMCLTQFVDLVVGPETAITNAAGCYETPKVTLLSHSTHENLCKYWANDYCLAPDPAIAPCYPCHQLHYTQPSCPMSSIIENSSGDVLANGPACAMGAITGEVLQARLNEVYSLGPIRSMVKN
jgi:hypothetical protein